MRTLKAILLLQSLSQKHGGAGACRIEWEVDDAVWMEGGGEDFARRGIELLKGVRSATSFSCVLHNPQS